MCSLGLAYAGTARQDIVDLLVPIMEDSSNSMEVISITALAISFIFVGTANPDVTQSIMQIFMEKDEAALNQPLTKLLCLALGLLFLGKGEVAEVTVETLKILE